MKILYVTRHFNHSGYLILKRLIDEKIRIEAVLLHDDNDRWRKPITSEILKIFYKLKCWYYRCEPLRTLNSEESLARKNHIPIIWADSIKSDAFYAELQKVNPDIIVLGGGWHELIPSRVFNFPSLGCINTHPSLLPEFRGTSITRWQILHGVEKSGSTIHYVDDTFDTGGVLAQEELTLDINGLFPQTLFYELGKIGADIMIPLLKRFSENGKLETYRVSHNPVYYNYYKRWEWNLDTLKINWNETFKEIHFKILANTQESYEYLGPYFKINKKRYFLRTSRLEKVEAVHADIKDHKIYIIKTENKQVYLYRKEEPYYLVLVQIQKFDKYYKYRRSTYSNNLLKLKPISVFNYEK